MIEETTTCDTNQDTNTTIILYTNRLYCIKTLLSNLKNHTADNNISLNDVTTMLKYKSIACVSYTLQVFINTIYQWIIYIITFFQFQKVFLLNKIFTEK